MVLLEAFVGLPLPRVLVGVFLVVLGHPKKFEFIPRASPFELGQRMFVVFDFTLRRLHKIRNRGYAGDAAAVIGELGHEALTEHADWLILHRERPLSVIHG